MGNSIMTTTAKAFLIIFIVLLYYHEIYPQNWVKLSPHYSNGDTIVDIDDGIFVSKEIGWIISSHYDTAIHSRIFKTTDGDNTWNLMINTGEIFLLNGFATDRMHYWVHGSRGKILRTTDGGTTWHRSYIGDSLLGEPIQKLYFFNNVEGIAVGGYQWSTINGGENWTILDTTNIRILKTDISFATRQRGWIASLFNPWHWDMGAIAITTDGGKSWSLQGEGSGGYAYAPGPLQGLFCGEGDSGPPDRTMLGYSIGRPGGVKG